MLKRVIGTLTVLVAAIGGSLVAAESASAASCYRNSVCFYLDAGPAGTWYYDDLNIDSDSGQCGNLSSDQDNKFSAVINNSERNVVLFEYPNCTGRSYPVAPYQTVPNLTWFNDLTTSYKV